MKTKYILGSIVCITILALFASMSTTKAKKLASSDKFKVIRVDGRIIFKRTNSDMKKGDIFVSGTELAFKSPQARAAVISSIRGRFVLSASEKGQTKILPAANNIASRSGALINKVDLAQHFSDRYLVLDKSAVEISQTSFPMDEDSFFYLMYEYNGEKIHKKLTNEGDRLIINKAEIFKIDGESIPVEEKQMTLYYRNADGSSKVSQFTPVFPDLEELKTEVEIIIEEFADKPDDVKAKEISAYLHEFYGKPNKENLSEWLASEFKIKG